MFISLIQSLNMIALLLTLHFHKQSRYLAIFIFFLSKSRYKLYRAYFLLLRKKKKNPFSIFFKLSFFLIYSHFFRFIFIICFYFHRHSKPNEILESNNYSYTIHFLHAAAIYSACINWRKEALNCTLFSKWYNIYSWRHW